MAATIQASAEVTIPSSGEAAAPQRADGPRALIARLAELHDEAAETALLANLLGRVPYLAAVLLGMACATAVLVHAGIAPLLTWLTLAAAGLVALMRAYIIAIAAPFARAPLRFFARDLQAVMLYVGFAWGAGSFLALSPDLTLFQSLAFGAGSVAIVALVVRASDVTLCFGIPVTVLSAGAMLTRPSGGSLFAVAAIVASGVAVMLAAYLSERASLRPENMRAVAIPTN